ncbi:DNA alkylation repair protein [Paenibacillus albus]|uniref:DNA alkylation repair protein n=1 Tax=Paenibacillus albus TaxID=2495582 RepID=A0A3Q8XAZ8_9BACL|nr:DNA alkylation repair protein [Paenibacillus albus]AZN42900.1 DNA alkylation repair protein [Paenibacillus albus]
MTYEEVMQHLAEMGSEQTKKTLVNHGAREPFYGVKVGDLKKLVKPVKKDQALALSLYDSGVSDAMYLAGLTVNPKTITKEQLQSWVRAAYWYLLAEYTVASVAAESPWARELAMEWIRSPEEMIAACGWSTYANYLSITVDEQLDMDEVRGLLHEVRDRIHIEQNRVRYTMNGFLISAAAYVRELHEEAIEIAEVVGKVHVNVGNTACKVPLAAEYITKMAGMGKIGIKRKTCIC